MLKRHHRLMVSVFAVSDAALSVLALYLAWYLRFVRHVLVGSPLVSRLVQFEAEVHPCSRYVNSRGGGARGAAVVSASGPGGLWPARRRRSLGGARRAERPRWAERLAARGRGEPGGAEHQDHGRAEHRHVERVDVARAGMDLG